MAAKAHIRSLYRSILRELPARPSASARSPLRTSIREYITTEVSSSSSSSNFARRQEAEQFVQYLRAQRMYGTLLERYNPGMGLDEEERVRLSARRVGMNLPVEWKVSKS